MKIEKVYSTILILAIGILIIGLFFSRNELIYLSFGVLFFSSINDNIARFIALLWLKLGEILAGINSKIILSIFFVFILIPMSFSKRFFGTKSKTNKKTNWITGGENEKINFSNPW